MRRPKGKENAQRKCPATYIARTLVYADSYRFCLKTLIFSLGFAADRSNIYLMLSYSHFLFGCSNQKSGSSAFRLNIKKSLTPRHRLLNRNLPDST